MPINDDPRPVRLPDNVPGQLLLGPLPGRYRPLARDLDGILGAGADLIVCLMPRKEVDLKSSVYAALLVSGDLPLPAAEFAIEDLNVPARDEAFTDFIDEMAGRLRACQTLFIHCAGGIGRTGTVAGCILAALGQDPEAALDAVREAGSFPQSPRQEAMVAWYAEQAGREAIA